MQTTSHTVTLPVELWQLVEAYANARIDAATSGQSPVAEAYAKLAESNLKDALVQSLSSARSLSKVHLLMKHPQHPWNARHHLAAGEVMGVYLDRSAPKAIADQKNARNPSFLWAVRTKAVSQ